MQNAHTLATPIQKCSLIRKQASHGSESGRTEVGGRGPPSPACEATEKFMYTVTTAHPQNQSIWILLAISKHTAQFFSGQKMWEDVTCEGTKNFIRIKCCSFWRKIFHCSMFLLFSIIYILYNYPNTPWPYGNLATQVAWHSISSYNLLFSEDISSFSKFSRSFAHLGNRAFCRLLVRRRVNQNTMILYTKRK